MSRRVLFLGGGRRTGLAQLFIKKGFSVFGYELSDQVPLAAYATILPGLPWKDPGLATDISAWCHEHHISLVLPLDDEAVVALAHAKECGGLSRALATCVVARHKAALSCWDKQQFENVIRDKFGQDNEVYPFVKYHQPAIIKPRFGFGSRGIREVESATVDSINGGGVAQLKLHPPEFTVDCYFNRVGHFIGASPRERLRVAGGEVIESRTLADQDLVEQSERLGAALGLTGPACFQFMTAPDGRRLPIECNCRLGGGSTLSIHAGFDFVGLIIQEYFQGQTIVPGVMRAKPGVYMTRSYQDHFFQ